MNDNNEPAPYTTFIPGRDFRHKMSKFLFLTGERLAIAIITFSLTFFLAKQIFPYNLGLKGLFFLISGFVVGIFCMLPAPSNPNQLMYKEITIRNFKRFARAIFIKPLDWRD
ncbi:hypothetical protein WOSG25_110270 [Weissella oryzae SG25]|uniref:Uncharacterized protein n=1 Tax=Weissella oryzae (strain DSM 25784 / JCM 18191 / LMG 30913 / SG25) TaxID=1329250 RepID=A0A069CVN6_WEIOS|nr:hypothetical protein [Weissella oryzae]GAK31549.1 hypothetical protein WOSG25_110270 [Weissella oryzae SG25]